MVNSQVDELNRGIGGDDGSMTSKGDGITNGEAIEAIRPPLGEETDVEVGQDHQVLQEVNDHHSGDEEAREDDDDDDYLLSDDNDVDIDNHRLGYNPTLLDHSEYLTSTLSHALDSLELDKSLVLQAKLSGMLNNENQKINEKRAMVMDKLKLLKRLHSENFDAIYHPEVGKKISKVGRLSHDIKDIETRIRKLKYGESSNLLGLFKKTNDGIINKYPVEYNQAKDKVLERQLDD